MREQILAQVRAALEGRDGVSHPGDSPPTEQRARPSGDVVDRFTASFQAAGGEVVRFQDPDRARQWAATFAAELTGVVQSALVPSGLRLALPDAPPERAQLGVSMALHAVAETGSLLLGSTEGRRLQLLPSTHLVWVPAEEVCDTLAEALGTAPPVGVSALALHSGPSKSADIGRIVVTGVHGPARVVAAVVG